MAEKEILNYISKLGMNPNQRIERNGGGQYFKNFMHDFAQYVIDKTRSEVVANIRKMKFPE